MKITDFRSRHVRSTVEYQLGRLILTWQNKKYFQPILELLAPIEQLGLLQSLFYSNLSVIRTPLLPNNSIHIRCPVVTESIPLTRICVFSGRASSLECRFNKRVNALYTYAVYKCMLWKTTRVVLCKVLGSATYIGRCNSKHTACIPMSTWSRQGWNLERPTIKHQAKNSE